MTYGDTIHQHDTPLRCIRCGGIVTEFQRPSALAQVELCPTCGPVTLATTDAIAARAERALLAAGYAPERARRQARHAVRSAR